MNLINPCPTTPARVKEETMSIARVTELKASSNVSVQDALEQGVSPEQTYPAGPASFTIDNGQVWKVTGSSGGGSRWPGSGGACCCAICGQG